MNTPRPHRCLLTAALLLTTTCPHLRAASPALSISDSPTPNAFPLVTATQTADIHIDPHDAKVVQIAANLLAADIERVTGKKPAVTNAPNNDTPTLLAGTLGSNPEIDALVASHQLDVASIKDKWEAYEIALLPNHAGPPTLVIAGSDRRATAFGLLSLSQSIGVSPWYWWADVTPQKKSALYLSLPAPLTDAPAVKYRGIFINDEDWGLYPWAAKTFDPQFKNIGPKTYEKVFELMLRLRLNYLWPAMHACSTEFGSVPENAALANDYAIAAGASHCEPMLYNNVKWNEKTKGPWNYATNSAAIHAAWEDSAKSRGNYEAVWTLGIRGIHDAAMEAPKDTKTRINILSQVITDQRQLLNQYVTKNYGPISQCFVPYKEVQPIYDAGLQVPPDVTLVWADDNFGYIRRLSNPDERKRPGGSGVYFHLSYYGQPHSYTWINTTPPALLWEELHKAWDNDARTLWVLNVGDIKPAEIGISDFADLAWKANTLGPDSQPRFLSNFADKTFGKKSVQPIMIFFFDFYRLGTIRKPEEMDRDWAASFDDAAADALERDYQRLLEESDAAAATIPADARDAYTEMIGFPAHILADTGLLFMADRKHNKDEVARLHADLEAQVANYNDNLAGGKWKYIMPGLETGKDLTKWSSQVRWPWGEKPDGKTPSPAPGRSWRPAFSADYMSSTQNAAWTPVPYLGHSGRALALLPATLDSHWELNDPHAPSLEFNFMAKDPSPAPDALISFLPTFRLYPGTKLRVAIALDNQPPTPYEIPGSSGTEDERGPIRSNAVQSNSVQLKIPLTNLPPGQHTLKISAIDPGPVIDQLSLP
ncbi:MAG TPA: glycosyl hydrolase 115 family protein [Phycisphaerae bacterium]|nr:glycosyl hydrolase 115 family protein [Phycisphaerae bacterium]